MQVRINRLSRLGIYIVTQLAVYIDSVWASITVMAALNRVYVINLLGNPVVLMSLRDLTTVASRVESMNR